MSVGKGQARGPSPGAEEKADVATIVRALRNRAGLTLKELAQRSEVSMSTVSKIENGLLLPGYETIQRLAIGLNADVAELFKPHVQDISTGRRGITKRGQGIKVETSRYTYEALAGDVSRKRFLPLVATIRAREVSETEPLPAHEGEELIFVLSGSVRLHSEHYEPLLLEPGDSVYIDSRAGHALTSCGIGDATVIWICSDLGAAPDKEGR